MNGEKAMTNHDVLARRGFCVLAVSSLPFHSSFDPSSFVISDRRAFRSA